MSFVEKVKVIFAPNLVVLDVCTRILAIIKQNRQGHQESCVVFCEKSVVCFADSKVRMFK